MGTFCSSPLRPAGRKRGRKRPSEQQLAKVLDAATGVVLVSNGSQSSCQAQQSKPITTPGDGGEHLMLFSGPDGVTWSQARDWCLLYGTDLASVQSEAQNEAVNQALLSAGAAKAWIGLNYQTGTSSWKDGAEWVYSNWRTVERSVTRDDCGVIHAGSDWNGMWNDEPCSMTLFHFVCGVGCPTGQQLTVELDAATGFVLGSPANHPSCEECPSGRYRAGYSTTACIECPATTYSARQGSSECTVCEDGKYTDKAGSSACVECHFLAECSDGVQSFDETIQLIWMSCVAGIVVIALLVELIRYDCGNVDRIANWAWQRLKRVARAVAPNTFAVAPSNFHYNRDPPLLTAGVEMTHLEPLSTPEEEPAPTFSVAEDSPLPNGLAVHATTGVVTGTPIGNDLLQANPDPSGVVTWIATINATNDFGSTSAKITFTIKVQAAPKGLRYAEKRTPIGGGPSGALPEEDSTAAAFKFVLGQVVKIVPLDAGFQRGAPVTDLAFKVSSGDLPLGLKLNMVTGAIAGQVSKSSPPGNFQVTVTASNDSGAAEEVIVMELIERVDAYDENAVHGWTADQVQLWLRTDLEFDNVVSELFAGVDGAMLAGLQSPDADFWQSREGTKVPKTVCKLVQSNAKDLVEKHKDAEESKVLNDQEKAVLRETAGAGRSVSEAALSKFDEFFSLRTGRPKEAAGGLETRLSVHRGKAQEVFLGRVGRGVEGMKEEVAEFVATAVEGGEEREVGELLDYILHQGTSEKEYENGIRDRGRPEGLRLEYFTSHEKAQIAGLSEAEVVAMRLYTTMAYKFMNNPLRDDARASRSEACPLSVSTYHANQGIRKLRQLNAPELNRQLSGKTVDSVPGASMDRGGGEGTVSQGMTLWRGMRSVKVTDEFLKEGGTELAFMSTTMDIGVAVRYSLSGQSLLFKIKARDFMVIGADVQWLSAFPGEREVLYPPLTYLRPTGKTEGITVERGGKQINFVVVEVEPVMG